MSDWTFEMTTAGELIEFTPSVEKPDRGEFGDYLVSLGFDRSAIHALGDTEGDYLEWYERKQGTGHKYLAVWGSLNETKLIFVPDWPTLVKLQALAAPILQTQMLHYQLSNLHEFARKAYRAWHGHEAVDSCKVCDPNEMARRAELRAERAKSGTKGPDIH